MIKKIALKADFCSTNWKFGAWHQNKTALDKKGHMEYTTGNISFGGKRRFVEIPKQGKVQTL
jgi:hypothetical protein